MKSRIKNVAVACLRVLLRVFYIFPVKKNRIMFLCYMGKQYSCNPRAIFCDLNRRYPGQFECVWAFQEPSRYADGLDFPARVVKYKSFLFHYYMLTAKIIVNNHGISTYFPLRKSQNFINTWHGGGAYKRVGISAAHDAESTNSVLRLARMTSYFISSSKKFSAVMSEAMMIPQEKMLEVGMPRNDVFFSPHPEISEKVSQFYSLDKETHIALYAPTFRGNTYDAHDANDDLNIDQCLEALSDRFGGKWVLLYRAHYFVKPQGMSADNILNASDYPDMQELLYAADVLITDYSSCMWDMSLTGKPCFIYATDASEYQQERDFYTPMSEWPFPVAESNDSLAAIIRNFDQQKYAADVQSHHNALGNCETGHASQLVSELIYKICFSNNLK